MKLKFIIIGKIKSGFSLVEILIVIFIISIAFMSFYTVSTVGTKYIIESKNRLAAVALVNEKMEIVRNLAYDKVGIWESVDIPGNILQTENVTANGRSYQVATSVRYFDDPMDGTVESSPADSIPNDYKIVRVVVSWNDSNGQLQSVSSTSRFVPPGLETSVGGSPLSINVNYKNGSDTVPVSQASVHITNSSTSPIINDTIQTDDDGHIMLPAAKIASSYNVTLTKSGYETVETMDSSDTFTPIYRHVDVVSNFLNQYSFEQNKLSNIIIKSADYQNNPVGNIEFSIGGGKLIGHDNLDNPVFNMSNTEGNEVFGMSSTTGTTDATSGEKEYEDISPGNYIIGMNANTQYEFIDFDPSISPAVLSPESDLTYTIRVADKNVNALFLEIKDSDASHIPIAGAKVTLKDGDTDVFTEKQSSLNGVVFYPDGATPLDNKTYNLEVDADGYGSGTKTVSIDKLTHVEMELTRN